MQIRDILIDFDDPTVFLDEYERHLSSGWIFVPSEHEFGLGEVVEVTVDLSFCGHSARALGIVKSRISPSLAAMLQRPSGAVIEFADGIDALEEMLRDTVEGLTEARGRAREPLATPRRHRRLEVSIRGECGRAGRVAECTTQNLSASGALLEVRGLDLEVDQEVSLSLVNPKTGELVAISGRVVRAALPAEVASGAAHTALEPESTLQGTAPQTASGQVAVAFVSSSEVDTRKARFLEQVRAVTYGQRMGSLSGNLSGVGLPSLLPSIASSSEQGSMEIIGDGHEALLLFEANRLSQISLGRVAGIKALARLLEWREGEFSFQPTTETRPPTGELIPVDVALREAQRQASQLDELRDRLLPDTVVLERKHDTAVPHTVAADPVSETERAVLEELARPGCPGTLLDALPQSDAEIWRAILGLLERGILTRRE